MKDALEFLYEPPVFPVPRLYIYINVIISQAFFYCHLSPIILFYLAGNMVVFYLINKYLLLRSSKIPDMFDESVFETIIGFTLNIPLFHGFSSILFLNLRGDA